MKVTNCSRCGGDHEHVEMQKLEHPVMPRDNAVWVEFVGEGTSKQERYELLRAKLNSDPGVAAVEWRDLAWNAWAPCPANGQPIMIYEV